MTRWIRFFFMIIIGVGLGLLYGWLINPVEYVDTTPDSMREDYRTDFVLMVAEMYQSDGNIDYAVQRLSFLGEGTPQEKVQDALLFASQVGYPLADLSLLKDLYDGVEHWTPSTKVPSS
ncbi:MAG: hypothetical protein J7L73_06560 [Anaerolineales bacterium]|nr:hypothetical protein [Anaerolineales bacterium]HEY61730.1 hypothetical protein [Anaerolineae bacterium]